MVTTAICNSSSREHIAFFWPLWALHVHSAHGWKEKELKWSIQLLISVNFKIIFKIQLESYQFLLVPNCIQDPLGLFSHKCLASLSSAHKIYSFITMSKPLANSLFTFPLPLLLHHGVLLLPFGEYLPLVLICSKNHPRSFRWCIPELSALFTVFRFLSGTNIWDSSSEVKRKGQLAELTVAIFRLKMGTCDRGFKTGDG